MNLSKDQMQRAILGVILVLTAIYSYFTMLLGPLGQEQISAEKGMKDLEPKLKEARMQLNRTRSIEAGDKNSERAQAVRDLIEEGIPHEAAIVWLPQRISEIFQANGIENISVSFDKSQPDSELSGFSRSLWTINVQSAGYHELAGAIASLENHFGLGSIFKLEIQTTPGNVDKQSSTLLFSTVTRR